jgi:hypothetical protein
MLKPLRVIAAALLLAGIGLFYAREIWSSSSRAHAMANHITNASSDHEQTQENILAAFWRWTTRDPVSFYTAVLSLFSGILVIVSFIQIRYLIRSDKNSRDAALAAKLSADVAEKALVAANRPWVKVDIQVGGPIIFNENGANFTLKYILTNIGHSPATNVWVSPRVIIPINDLNAVENFNPRTALHGVIAELKKRSPSPLGFALFPAQIIIQDITVSISRDEIRRATTIGNVIFPTIIGAVDYRMLFDDKPHQTGFIVEIRRSDVPRPTTIANNRWAPAIFVDEGDIPAADVRLLRSIIEGGYAD